MLDRLISVDPGKSGGLAIFWEGGQIEAHPYRDDEETYSLLSDAVSGDPPGLVCYMELVGGYVGGGGQPGSAMLRFGEGFGYYKGLLRGLGIPLRLVTPQKWQAGIPGLAKLKGEARKRVLKAHAGRIFPDLKPTLKTADALLIGDWARRQN
jgi:hypothetical protein